jgi:tetratricopeptide (TPR) repeat protein
VGYAAIKKIQPAKRALERRIGVLMKDVDFGKHLSPASRALCILDAGDPRVSLRFTLGFMLSPALRAVKSHRFRLLKLVLLVVVSVSGANAIFAQRRTAAPPSGSLTITSEPNTTIWIDEVRRGVTDASGRLELKKISAGRHVLRVRSAGFREVTMPLPAGRKTQAVKLTRTTDQAELAFQQAEGAREQARDETARENAAELYRATLKLRGTYPAAHLGLARVLLDLNKYEDALDEIQAARQARPVYPEASAVEGRIYREAAFTDDAIQSFRRAIREARGFQPEAHVGLARVFEDQGKYAEAIVEFRKAIDQLSDSEPVIYQLLGAAYERTQQYKEAVVAYEKYFGVGAKRRPRTRHPLDHRSTSARRRRTRDHSITGQRNLTVCDPNRLIASGRCLA